MIAGPVLTSLWSTRYSRYHTSVWAGLGVQYITPRSLCIHNSVERIPVTGPWFLIIAMCACIVTGTYPDHHLASSYV